MFKKLTPQLIIIGSLLLVALVIVAIVIIKKYHRESLHSLKSNDNSRRYELKCCNDKLKVGESIYSQSNKSQATLLQDGLLLMNNETGQHKWLWKNESNNKVGYMSMSYSPSLVPIEDCMYPGNIWFTDENNKTFDAILINCNARDDRWSIILNDDLNFSIIGH